MSSRLDMIYAYKSRRQILSQLSLGKFEFELVVLGSAVCPSSIAHPAFYLIPRSHPYKKNESQRVLSKLEWVDQGESKFMGKVIERNDRWQSRKLSFIRANWVNIFGHVLRFSRSYFMTTAIRRSSSHINWVNEWPYCTASLSLIALTLQHFPCYVLCLPF